MTTITITMIGIDMKYSIILLLSLTHCSTNYDPTQVDAELRPYFIAFQNIIGVNTSEISGKLMDLNNSEDIGLCDINVDDAGIETRTVFIDKNFWNSSTPDGRIMTVFHELGHCAMRLAHITSIDIHDCPTSLMFPQDFSRSNCFAQNENAYYAEMRSHKLK